MAKKEEKIVEEVVEKVKETKAKPSIKEQDLVPEVTVKEDGVHKVDFTNLVPKKEKTKKEDALQRKTVESVQDTGKDSTETREDPKVEVPQPTVEEPVQDEQPVIEEITDKKVEEKVEDLQEEIIDAVEDAQETGAQIPENIQKVISFMNETGGSLGDYVKLNTDVNSLNDAQLLQEFYQTTKPHLDQSEINFLIEDNFAYNEEEDEERDVKRKKLARKEELANAKNYLNKLKDTYYEEIKAGSKLTKDQQNAVNFFDRYSQNKKIADKQKETFTNKTNQIFNKDFKGFEYKVGDKRYRYNVKNANEVKDTQSDISNFVKKFLNKNNEMQDASGYHKSLFTAMNPDAIANHFYEQGKSDAMQDSIAKAKNVSMDSRQGHQKSEIKGTVYKSLDSSGNEVKWGFKV